MTTHRQSVSIDHFVVSEVTVFVRLEGINESVSEVLD